MKLLCRKCDEVDHLYPPRKIKCKNVQINTMHPINSGNHKYHYIFKPERFLKGANEIQKSE